MIEINPRRFKTMPFLHQLEGIRKLVDNDAFALFDEMGAGKSKQVIDAACTLAYEGQIDTVLIIVPASCRIVWVEPEIGEIRKHSWVAGGVWEYHAKSKEVWSTRSGEPPNSAYIQWVVTNYEFLRSDDRLTDLCERLKHSKVMLVLDESAYIKSRTAKQTKAVAKLRTYCKRCVILNGTPVTNSPMDLWSQMNVLSPKILSRDYKNFFNFRAEYCDMVSKSFGGRRPFQKVTGYRRLDQLAKKLAPYVLRRLKKDCLDLPEKLYTVREVALKAESWKRYQELKKDLLITLESGDKQLEPNAAVRVMRLAQLTSGILGSSNASFADFTENVMVTTFTQDMSDEKLQWAVQYLTEECEAKAVIVWTRWRRERERLSELLGMKLAVYELYGGQKQKERDAAVMAFMQASDSTVRSVLIAQPHAGGHGLNLVVATEAIYLSNDFALGVRLQSEDRCHRPGQTSNVTYVDVLATGPHGQRTIDHVIFEALRAKQEIANFTCNEWRRKLKDE